ncbi:MAG: pyruvate synthase [Candidatus Lambdaproteobacteria bacterium]|nr:pyruvate synthase [Candidatus Lambdaproteobacteria bacterium]
MCPGCGGLEVVKQVYDVLGENTVFVNAAGCLTLLATYPFTPFRGSWIYTAMASAPAGAQGIRDALDILIAKGRLPPAQNLDVVVLSGDGAAYGMGLGPTSAAIDRGLDFYYLCYDNEGYGNTGQQTSAATPAGARTATDHGPVGFAGEKKDLFSIWVAHHPPYVATITSADPVDLARKVETARGHAGPKLFIALAQCPTGWHYDPKDTVQMGRLAVATGIWPLKAYAGGRVTHTRRPKPKGERPPVEEYLRAQGRFDHLFSPTRNEEALARIQARVDAYWDAAE